MQMTLYDRDLVSRRRDSLENLRHKMAGNFDWTLENIDAGISSEIEDTVNAISVSDFAGCSHFVG